MKCPICGGAELVQDTRDVTHSYKGESTLIPAVTAEFCSACGEFLAGPDESKRVSGLMNDFNRQVNAAAIDPAFIVTVRKQLGLDQREAGQIFGGGVNAFSRYERGIAKPPLAVVKMLKLLSAHPDLLAEVRAA